MGGIVTFVKNMAQRKKKGAASTTSAKKPIDTCACTRHVEVGDASVIGPSHGSCHSNPAGYATPMDAMLHGSHEKMVYVTCVVPRPEGATPTRPDYLATVDVDPASETHGQIIHRLHMPCGSGDELHHFGWDTCSSCFGVPGKARRHLILPGGASPCVFFSQQLL